MRKTQRLCFVACYGEVFSVSPCGFRCQLEQDLDLNLCIFRVVVIIVVQEAKRKIYVNVYLVYIFRCCVVYSEFIAVIRKMLELEVELLLLDNFGKIFDFILASVLYAHLNVVVFPRKDFVDVFGFREVDKGSVAHLE